MVELARMAMRNVWRQPRRTMLTGAAVMLSVATMVVAEGFVAFTLHGLQRSVVHGGLGHLQVLGADEHPRTRLDESLVETLQAQLRSDPRVDASAARIGFEGLVSSADATVAASGLGVDPTMESRIRSSITFRAGAWFLGREGMPNALVGVGLARRLAVTANDVVSIIAYSDAGRMTAVDAKIAGVFESGVVEYDARVILVPLPAARELMETDGASALVATVHHAAAAGAVADRVARQLRRAGHGGRVLTWQELSPVYESVVALYRWIARVFFGALTIAVVLGVANTMTMAVLERVGEVGILRALGCGRGRIALLFLIEALAIGALGSVGGVLIGTGACQLVTWLAFEMPPPPGRSYGYLLEVPVSLEAVVGASIVAIGAAALAGLLPSLSATRGEVADALRA